jgi:hypothetical protein
MQRFSVVLKDASFNSTEQGCIFQHQGTAWHPSTPRNSVASFITTEYRGFLQHHEAAWHPSTPRSNVASFKKLFRIVEVCHAAP